MTAPDSFVDQACELAENFAASATDEGFTSGLYGRNLDALRAHLERQAARCKELEEDAARYQTVRARAFEDFTNENLYRVRLDSRPHGNQSLSSVFDAAVDAARSVLSQKEQG